jgi:hypothetical protein
MIRISKATGWDVPQVIDAAERFFGPAGIGLPERERGPCGIVFAGADGYVAVQVVEEAAGRRVDVESREYEYHAKKFLSAL